MSGGPPPKGSGVVVLYENVKVTVTDGQVRVEVTRPDGSEAATVISQVTGDVVGGSDSPS